MVAFRQPLIRIVGVPPGEAPQSIREQWVGLVLPLAPDFPTTCQMETFGVISGKKDEEPTIGYVVDIEAAMAVLARKSPEAVSWWREHAPDLFCEGGTLVFDERIACELVEHDDA